jgi:hypothetical protein
MYSLIGRTSSMYSLIGRTSSMYSLIGRTSSMHSLMRNLQEEAKEVQGIENAYDAAAMLPAESVPVRIPSFSP